MSPTVSHCYTRSFQFTDRPRLSALQILHRCDWVHRDLSIANILLDDGGGGRLVDFEYAKTKDNEEEGYMVSLAIR